MPIEFTLSPTLQYIIWKALRAHRKMEKNFLKYAREIVGDSLDLDFPNLHLNTIEYLSKNVFSIFFTSIIDHLQIAPHRKKVYCLITHLIRGIVTAADNMIDNENKGAVMIRNMNGRIIPNVILTLIQNGLLTEVVYELTGDKRTIRKISTELLNAMVEIGTEESTEENGIEEVLSPEVLLQSIHHYRGGKLLTLPFVAPLIVEEELKVKLEKFRTAMYKIGMAVQMLDDITDFTIDIRERNHNILRSLIVHRKENIIKDYELSAMVEGCFIDPEKTFPQETKSIVRMAISSAFNGFEIMTQNGYPIDRINAEKLLKTLFKSRNVEHLWNLYQSDKLITV